MNSSFVGALVFACTFGAALLAARVRRALPEHHLGADTKDTVKLARGLVATMSALVLGLLVAAAKGSYDTQRTAVIQMAGKAVYLDRLLAHCGPEAAEARATLRQGLEGAIAQIWPTGPNQAPRLAPNFARSEAVLDAIERLAPQTDAQRAFKTQALAAAWDLGQMRWLLFEQAGTTISTSLLVAALSVSGAIFLILGLDQPFGGLLRVSNQPLLNTLSQLGL